MGENMDAKETAVTGTKSLQFEKTIGRIMFLLILVVAVINIPINRSGLNLARAMPDSSALVIRDGLLLKGSGPEVYVLQDNQRRWIGSLEAFHGNGYHWQQVHEVENEFLTQFEEGKPIHLLLKCPTSPHVYVLEDGTRHWIEDIHTFQTEGYAWEDIQLRNCEEIDRLPLGVPIPEDAGTPPPA
jgi:hypothetical protein